MAEREAAKAVTEIEITTSAEKSVLVYGVGAIKHGKKWPVGDKPGEVSPAAAAYLIKRGDAKAV